MEPGERLVLACEEAGALNTSIIEDAELRALIQDVVTCASNRAPARFLLACTLAKWSQPEVDILKPYTEIGGPDAYSGRTFDERYITPFRSRSQLPLNPTTAFLTPAFRNINRPLSSATVFEGRPREAYTKAMRVLEAVQEGRVTAREVLTEAVRQLRLLRDAGQARLSGQLEVLRARNAEAEVRLSSEDIFTLLVQHLQSRNASRLPVLVVKAVYDTLTDCLKETALPLGSHNAADSQTGSLGDVEITLRDGGRVVTVYEVKDRRVTTEDLDHALTKITQLKEPPDNYLFITTQIIEKEVADHAKALYDKTGGVEFAVLDCLGFARHFLHLFHRSRQVFLEHYQDLVLSEPPSAVRQELKEVWLALRNNAEAAYIAARST